jgi:elongation factor G
MKDRLGANVVPFTLPIGAEDRFIGVIDLIAMQAYHFDEVSQGLEMIGVTIPSDMVRQAQEWREKLLEEISSHDEGLMDKYLSGKEILPDELWAAARRETIAMKITPVFCGSAFKNKGIQLLLDGVTSLLPSPRDIEAVEATLPGDKSKAVIMHADPNAPFSALAFKIMSDPFVGTLTYVRVYSGTLTSGSHVYNSIKDRKERVSRILQMHANKREEIQKVEAGDIAAVVGLKFATTGDTLCDQECPVVLESIEFPEPVIAVAIEPKTNADQEKLSESLAKLAAEDPSFRVKIDHETGQTIISGMGELHLEIIVDRLMREFKVGANVGKPQVAYRETLSGSTEIEGKYIRQTGGHGQYGHVWLRLEPLPRGQGFEFVDDCWGKNTKAVYSCGSKGY